MSANLIVDPLVEDRVLAGAAEAFGGPPGRRARLAFDPRPALFGSAVAGAITATIAFAVTLPCVNSDGSTEERYSHLCYSDFPAQFLAVDSEGYGPFGGADRLPPLVSTFLWLVAQSASEPKPRILIASILIATAWVIASIFVARWAGRRAWDGALFATIPIAVFTMYISATVFAVLAVLIAIVAFTRERSWSPYVAGLAYAAAVCTDPVALLLAVPLLAYAWRTDRLGAYARAAVVAIPVWLLLNLSLIRNGDLLGVYLRDGNPRYGSIWFLLDRSGLSMTDDGVRVVAAILSSLLILTVALFVVFAARVPNLAAVLLLAVSAGLLVAPTLRPQDTLWIAVFAVVAWPRAAALWTWAAAQIAYVAALWLYLELSRGDKARGVPVEWYSAFTVIALLATLALVVTVLIQQVLGSRAMVRDLVTAEGDRLAESVWATDGGDLGVVDERLTDQPDEASTEADNDRTT